MKAHIFYWACQYDLSQKTGFPHNSEIPVEDIPKVMMNIFNLGLNVRLDHVSPSEIILFVDTKRFTQR